MKVKTEDLIGPALNWAVAVADKRIILGTLCKDIVVRGRRADGSEIFDDSYSFTPSVSWSQGGPIIERERISVANDDDEGEWEACQRAQLQSMFGFNGDNYSTGPTPLIAAMRCFVASRLGDEVDVPDELV